MIPATRLRIGCLGLLTALLVGVGSFAAAAPAPEAVRWLEQSSLEARRITGVGDGLTLALQTKGELLAAVAAWQETLGQTDAAQQNHALVKLCLRALEHDREAGWVRAGQAWAAARTGAPNAARDRLDDIADPDEKAWAAYRLRDVWGVLTPVSTDPTTLPADAVSPGFRIQLSRQARHTEVWARAQSLSVPDASAYFESLNPSAERAWAALAIAEGLITPRTPTAIPATPAVDPETPPTTSPPESGRLTPAVEVTTPDAPPHDRPASPDIPPLRADPLPEPSASQPADPTADPPPDPPAAPGSPSASPTTPLPAPAVIPNSAPLSADMLESANPLEARPRLSPTPTPEADVPPATPTAPDPTPGPADQESTLPEPTSDLPTTPDPSALILPGSPPPPTNDPAPIDPTATTPTLPILPDLNRLAQPDRVLTPDPAPEIYEVQFITTQGAFTVRVHRGWAPAAADRFHDLCRAGYYHNQRFFRVVPGFVAQWGIHGFPAVAAPWRAATFPDEPRTQANRRGTIAFAAAAVSDSRTTQVFINLADHPFLDELGFAPFGEVIDGLATVESLFSDHGEAPSARQRDIQLQGNAFLDKQYPGLDSIVTVTIQSSPATP
ncbi:MAG: peptidylprolyl isomerase [Planctomycetota bacterium]